MAVRIHGTYENASVSASGVMCGVHALCRVPVSYFSNLGVRDRTLTLPETAA
jgi:hypothetical protein